MGPDTCIVHSPLAPACSGTGPIFAPDALPLNATASIASSATRTEARPRAADKRSSTISLDGF
jgi:hypothetical protein